MENRVNPALVIGFVFLHSILFLQHDCSAQSKYEFKPGSRQAVEVTPSQTVPHQSTVRRGGMTLRRNYRRGQIPRAAAGEDPRARTGAVQKSTTGPRSYSFQKKVIVDNMTRTCRVYVPSSYSPSRSMPLMLVFHGLQMSGDSMTAVTGFNGIASRNGFIVAYCDSANGRWSDGMNDVKGVDDLAYVKVLFQGLRQKLSIDQRRIYAVGLSNGGYFAQMLACAMSAEIAAVAVVGSTAMEQALKPSTDKPVPAVFFFGSEDPLINWGDGRGRSLGRYGAAKDGKDPGIGAISPEFYALSRLGGWMSVSDTVAWWTAHNGANNSPYSSYEPDRDPTDGTRVKKEVYGNRGREVIVYTIEGGEHSWPGALALPGMSRKTCQDVEASEIIWKFFKENSR